VVLVGDLLDFWRYGPSCVRAHEPHLKALARLGPYYVLGNHDYALVREHAPRLPPGFTVVRGLPLHGYAVLHGDQFDPEPGLWRRVGKAACRGLAWIGRFWPAAEDWLSNAGSRIEGLGRFGNPDHYEQAALDYAFAAGRKGAIIGHTHRVCHNGPYINTGMWASDGWTLIYDDGTTDYWRL
jgi:UDP-2,3-diacylglucosamine pyrophosphatase LpxH